MLRSSVVDVPNIEVSGGVAAILSCVASRLQINESNIIRWAITATRGTDSVVVVTYVIS